MKAQTTTAPVQSQRALKAKADKLYIEISDRYGLIIPQGLKLETLEEILIKAAVQGWECFLAHIAEGKPRNRKTAKAIAEIVEEMKFTQAEQYENLWDAYYGAQEDVIGRTLESLDELSEIVTPLFLKCFKNRL